jgi:hypothetical protein
MEPNAMLRVLFQEDPQDKSSHYYSLHSELLQLKTKQYQQNTPSADYHSP